MHHTNTTNSNILLMYHANCHDGRMAAAVASDMLGSPVTVPINYDSNDVPAAEYIQHLEQKVDKFNVELSRFDTVYFVDFCPKPAQVEVLRSYFPSVIIIDHHKSAFDAMVEAGYTVKPHEASGWLVHGDDSFRVVSSGPDDSRHVYLYYMYAAEESGALMAYRYFHGFKADVPDYIKWVSDRDLWKFNYPESKPFAAGMSQYMSVHPGQLTSLLTPTGVDEMLGVGQAILNTQDAYVAKQLRNKIETVAFTDGEGKQHPVAMYNSTYLPSELCDAYWGTQMGVDIMALYTVIDASKVIYSVRSRAGVDSLWLAKHFGGGGHAQANGFSTDLLTLMNFLTLKTCVLESEAE